MEQGPFKDDTPSNVVKTIINYLLLIWEWLIPPIYGDLGDGLLVF